MALLHGAARLVETDARRWHLTVAHLDHGLRDDSADDARFVADAAEGAGTPPRVPPDRCCRARARRGTLDRGRWTRGALSVPRGRRAGGRADRDRAHRGRCRGDRPPQPPARKRAGRCAWDPGAARPHRAAPPGRAARDLTRSSRCGGHRATGWIRRTRTRPSFATGSATRSYRCSSRSVPVPQTASVSSADWPPTTRRCSTTLRGRSCCGGRTADGIDWREPPEAALGRRVLRLAIGEPAPNAERVEALMEAAAGERGGVTIELGGGRVASVSGRRIRILT